MKRTLLTIDPQNDFCEPALYRNPNDPSTWYGGGALYVQGAELDMQRLAKFLVNNGKQIDEVRVTLDSHQVLHIAHPICWIDTTTGKHPFPFTMITLAEVEGPNPRYKAFNPGFQSRYVEYVRALDANKRYPLFLWRPHCIIGSWGHGIYPAFSDALIGYCEAEFGMIDFVTKGSNIFSENYSAVKADVPDKDDPTTSINTDFIKRLQDSDEILITGEALSHCVANTIDDVAAEFGDDQVSKFVLLTDCSSPVGNPSGTTLFTDAAQAFIDRMTKKGMRLAKTTDF